jgi:hypothetical protein
MGIDGEDKAKYSADGSSQHTRGHVRCPACDERRTAMHIDSAVFSQIQRSCCLWLESRKFNGGANGRARFLAPATITGYDGLHARARPLLRRDPLATSTPATCTSTRSSAPPASSPRRLPARKQDRILRRMPRTVSPHKVNQELGTLADDHARAGCWTPNSKRATSRCRRTRATSRRRSLRMSRSIGSPTASRWRVGGRLVVLADRLRDVRRELRDARHRSATST